MAKNTVVVSVLADTANFKKEMGGLSSTFSTIGKGFGLAVGAMGAALAAVGLGKFVGEAATASDATDKFKDTLNFAGLKTDAIDALAKSTRAYADQTVYSLGDIQNITAQLAANSVPNYDKLAEAAGNLNAVAGGNAETFKSVGMALTQTAGAGKLTTENWNQMANAIPGASGKLQEALLKNGAYTGNFRDAMAKGQITADEFNTAIMKLGFDDVAVNAAKSTKTLEGSWGNLAATITGGLSDIISELKPFATEFMNKTSEVVGPALTQIKTVLHEQVIPALQKLSDFVKTEVMPNLEGFGKWITDNKGYLEALGVALAVLLGPLAAVKIAVTLLGIALDIWSGITKVATAVQAAFNFIMGLNPIVIVVLAVLALAAALIYFFTQTEEGQKIWAAFTDALKKIWDSIVKWFNETLDSVQKWFKEAGDNVQKTWNGVVSFFSELPGKIQNFFADAAQWLIDKGKGILEGLKKGATDAWGGVVAWFTAIPGNIKRALGDLGSLLIGAGEAVLNGFLQGMKNIWGNITGFVGGIAGWIRDHKGPISKDKTLLVPAAQAIMGGFLSTLKDGYGNVKDFISGIAPEISGADLGSLAMVPAGNNSTVNVYQFDGLTITTANDQDASIMEEFLAFARRRMRAA